MPKKISWIWKFYFIIFLFMCQKKLIHVFWPDSKEFLYYFILRAFDSIFHIPYCQYLLQVFLSALHCIVLFLFIYRIKWLNAEFWKYALILRCLFEVTGHSYELNNLIAFYRYDPMILLSILAFYITPHIPSYFASYWYAFKFDEITSGNKAQKDATQK